jgi:uncharacterized protein YdaU (DUF1376 family)
MFFYQFNIGDYQSHTSHLSDLEDLAYRRMLDWCYLHERPLPKNLEQIARLIRMPTHCECIATVLQEYFKEQKDGFVSDRVLFEISRTKEKAEKARSSARKRWDANALPTQSESNAIPIYQDTNIPIPKDEIRHPLDTSRHRLPCQHQKVIDLYHQLLPNHQKVEVWHKTRQGLLKTRWAEIEDEIFKEKGSVTEEEVLDWWTRFFGYIGKSKFLTGKTFTKERRPFMADLEWIVRPTNFTKIIERKYHGD